MALSYSSSEDNIVAIRQYAAYPSWAHLIITFSWSIDRDGCMLGIVPSCFQPPFCRFDLGKRTRAITILQVSHYCTLVFIEYSKISRETLPTRFFAKWRRTMESPSFTQVSSLRWSMRPGPAQKSSLISYSVLSQSTACMAMLSRHGHQRDRRCLGWGTWTCSLKLFPTPGS